VNGGLTPSYQWQVDGVNVGVNSPVFITNSLVTGNQVSVIMTGSALCEAAIPDTSDPVTITVSLLCNFTLNLKLILEGYYSTHNNIMNHVMVNQGIWNALITDVDTVTVELRSASDPSVLVTSVNGILQSNGNLIVNSSIPTPAAYWLCIKHRNSIETWSAAPVNFTGTSLSYDFTQAASQAFGNNMILVNPGLWAIYAGDLNQDGHVDGDDFMIYDLDSYEGVRSGYIVSDINGDGFVDGNDFPVFDMNIFNGVSSIKP
jgi:hypothetical protein